MFKASALLRWCVDGADMALIVLGVFAFVEFCGLEMRQNRFGLMLVL